MVKKRKKSKFERGTEARRIAREKVGTPPAAQIIPDRRRKPVKHKKSLAEDDSF